MRKLNIANYRSPSKMIRLELEYLTEMADIRRISPVEEQTLLQRIRSGDQTAIHPLVINYEFLILKMAKRFLHTGLPIAEMMSAAKAALTKLAHNELNKIRSEHFERFYTWTISQAIFQEVHNRQPHNWSNPTSTNSGIKSNAYKTLESHVSFLNNLNRKLKNIEVQIVTQAKNLLKLGEQSKTDHYQPCDDYEVYATVQYHLNNEEDPAHTFYTSFHYEEVMVNKHYGFLLDNMNETGWRESYMPELDEIYCYLLHDLLDHPHKKLYESIHLIDRIFVDINYVDQSIWEIGKDGKKKEEE